MKISTLTAIPLSLALTLAACGGGDDGGVCQLAAQHVSACLSRPAPEPPSCDEGLAARLLAADCGQIRSLEAGAGKADWLGDKSVYSPEAICDPDDPSDTGCEEYCRSIKVEYSFLGIFEVPGCLIHSSCDRVDDAVARCQCTFVPGCCGDDDPEPAPEEP